ncbi:glycosyltransferase family 2 protein [Candidatus Saccharibacteria bacterium]|nr:glycosyltransferase family 2 protein [Candidatus Saccharibacteria bacterium]
MLKLSIIIPVFNVEEYLKECLDSILAQKNRGIEIILVENYSSDKSYEICKDYKEKFPKVIKVFRTKKWGASAVRNYGVKKASGEYLWFIDSDDWIEKGAIEKVLGKVEKKEADVVCISVRRVYEDGRTNILTAVNPKEKNWKERYIMYGFPPFQNIYRKDFWAKNFEFPEGIIHEDMAILSTVILYTEKISAIDEVIYNYRQRKNSVLHQEGWNPHSLDIFKALGILYGKFNEKGMLERYKAEIEYFFIWNLLIDSAKDFRDYSEGKAGKEQTKLILKQFFPNWMKNKYFRNKSLKFKLNCYRGYLGI